MNSSAQSSCCWKIYFGSNVETRDLRVFISRHHKSRQRNKSTEREIFVNRNNYASSISKRKIKPEPEHFIKGNYFSFCAVSLTIDPLRENCQSFNGREAWKEFFYSIASRIGGSLKINSIKRSEGFESGRVDNDIGGGDWCTTRGGL